MAKTLDDELVAVTAVAPEPCCWASTTPVCETKCGCCQVQTDGCCSSSSSSCGSDCTKPKFWVAAQGTDEIIRYAYDPKCCSTCRIQSATTPDLPTALITNKCCSGFALSFTDPATGGATVTGPAQLIGATANGAVFGWNGSVNETGAVEVFLSTGAIYSGVALSRACQLYVANFAAGVVEVYDDAWALVTTFTDPALTAIGYAPSGIAIIDGFLYVLFAQQNEDADAAVPGIGNGFVDVFCTDGTLQRRLINRGPLNLPISIVKVGSNELYIANQGDGIINRFDQCSGQFLGPVTDCCKNPVSIDGITSLAHVPVCVKGECGKCAEGCAPGTCKGKLFVGAAPVQGANGLLATLSAFGPH